MLALGGITAVMGVLYALMQHDLKRLLAYHTVENIGIIFVGLGLALAFRPNGMAVAAALALTAALFHVFNHSLFKSLLFFGAGAVLTATGERDMEHLGGLIHRMPLTALRLPGRLRGDFGPAAAQRLRLRMADLPGHSAEPASAAMGPESSGAGGRRAAGAVGGARGGLLRQGLRHRPFSAGRARAAAEAASRNRPLVARRDVRPGRALSPCRNPARLRSSTRSRRSSHGADRRAHAGADRLALAFHRADRRQPQLL